jgi:hypothetical protein
MTNTLSIGLLLAKFCRLISLGLSNAVISLAISSLHALFWFGTRLGLGASVFLSS